MTIQILYVLSNSNFQKQAPKVFFKKRLFLKISQNSQENT